MKWLMEAVLLIAVMEFFNNSINKKTIPRSIFRLKRQNLWELPRFIMNNSVLPLAHEKNTKN